MLNRVYFDACCFIELAMGKFGKQVFEGGKHLWYMEALLRASKAGKIQVCTSLVSVSECISVGEVPISAEVQQLFMGMLTSGKGGVLPLQPDLWTFERARDLRWKGGINLKSPDNVHVAAALEAGCVELITLDGLNPEKKKSILGAADKLKPLGLRVVAPCDTLLIPDEFKQEKFKYENKQPKSKPRKPNGRRGAAPDAGDTA